MRKPGGGGAARGGSRVDEALQVVREAMERIDYGSVLITIHQGEVASIETSTKTRLAEPDPHRTVRPQL